MGQHTRACNINFAALPPSDLWTNHLLFSLEGADPLVVPAQGPMSARQRMEGRRALNSLSQKELTTGANGWSDARRAWTGPPQGASAGRVCRPLPSPVRDRRNLL